MMVTREIGADIAWIMPFVDSTWLTLGHHHYHSLSLIYNAILVNGNLLEGLTVNATVILLIQLPLPSCYKTNLSLYPDQLTDRVMKSLDFFGL